MKNVTLDRTTVIQLDADGTDSALDVAADCDVLRNNAPLERHARADARGRSRFRHGRAHRDLFNDRVLLLHGILAMRGLEAGAAVVIIAFGSLLLTGYIVTERMVGI